jgi:predicted DNA-binding transcriptional regulator AlpA
MNIGMFALLYLIQPKQVAIMNYYFKQKGDYMENEKLTITIPEFAKVFSISRGLAYDLARRNALPVPVIKLGKRMVLSRKAVEGLLSGETNLK